MDKNTPTIDKSAEVLEGIKYEVVEIDTATYVEEPDPPRNTKAMRMERLKPYQWKPGQSGNPKGRPDGKSMKEYAKELLAKMTDQEREAFLMGLPKEVIWRMAEGNPTEDRNLTVTVPRPILGGLTQAEQTVNILPAHEEPTD